MTDIPTLRSTIIAEEGYTLLSLDASQIELRVLAILSQDPQLLLDLQTGDLHMATALRMFGHTDDVELMDKRRYDAKQCNFAVVYGADEYKLAQMFGCSEQEALEFMAEHRRAYPRLYQWMEEQVRKAKENGYVVNMFGRIRPLPELQAGSWKIREKAEREVVNTIVQGGAVDIVKLIMLHLRSTLDRGIRLILQVHDEIVFETPNELLEEALGHCRELIQFFPDYPCKVTVGTRYSELKEVSNGNSRAD